MGSLDLVLYVLCQASRGAVVNQVGIKMLFLKFGFFSGSNRNCLKNHQEFLATGKAQTLASPTTTLGKYIFMGSP